ncbi:hypothetical protein, partial [Corynebacterium sp. CCUG 51687]|uniref:hypothetical protein n=1 Tax=Corynebacterium sp. CCUG 51687 TaxID=2823897 RepID=UPI0021089C8E
PTPEKAHILSLKSTRREKHTFCRLTPTTALLRVQLQLAVLSQSGGATKTLMELFVSESNSAAQLL